MAVAAVEKEQAVTSIGGNPASLPKKFYRTASLAASDGFHSILLDGKPARTRAGRALCAQSLALAEAIREEWSTQSDIIDGASMPMTRFQATVIDRGTDDIDAWRAAALAFLRSDLLCYRADAPPELASRQAAAFDPLLDWAAEHGVALKTGGGVGFISQPATALAAGEALLRSGDAASILGVKSAAEISGSAVIALALWRGAFDPERLFDASQVDEVFQAEKWGHDAEAVARQRALRRDFLDAARYLSLTASTGG